MRANLLICSQYFFAIFQHMCYNYNNQLKITLKAHKENTMEEKNIDTYLTDLQTLISETTKTHQYTHTNEIRTLSQKILAMKLNDDFLIKDLNAEQKKTLDLALILANF